MVYSKTKLSSLISSLLVGEKAMIKFLNNNFFESFWAEFVKKFSSPWIWYALAFAVVGITLLILAKRIARIIKQKGKEVLCGRRSLLEKNNIEKNDGAYITFVVVAMLFIMAAVVLFVVMS